MVQSDHLKEWAHVETLEIKQTDFPDYKKTNESYCHGNKNSRKRTVNNNISKKGKYMKE